MVDHLSREGRSRVMAAIRAKNTKPELALRQALRQAGAVGYRVHLRTLPGRPDIAYTRWRVAVFVDGVFWHGHPDHFKPETASPYWRDKIARNRERDRMADTALKAAGWTVVRMWDLEVKGQPEAAAERVIRPLRMAGWQPAALRGALMPGLPGT
jgi:DNA mismatch endonuclease, patch repair protein